MMRIAAVNMPEELRDRIGQVVTHAEVEIVAVDDDEELVNTATRVLSLEPSVVLVYGDDDLEVKPGNQQHDLNVREQQ